MEEAKCGLCGKDFEGFSKGHVEYQLRTHAGSKGCKPKLKEGE